jgi:hypothetical protein
LARTDRPYKDGKPPTISVTILSRAVVPVAIGSRSKKLAAIQDKAQWTGRIDYKALSDPDRPASTIVYSGPAGYRPLDIHVFKPPLPSASRR